VKLPSAAEQLLTFPFPAQHNTKPNIQQHTELQEKTQIQLYPVFLNFGMIF